MTNKYNLRFPIFLQGIRLHIWMFSGFKYTVECNTVTASLEVLEFSYCVVLLKIENTSFPYMEIMSHKNYSN